MNLLYFVLLTSVLIFVHEFGHFAFAKMFGVRVLTFSLGFGPALLRVQGKETEYRFALFPFGGFVKLLEQSTLVDPLPAEERERSFEAQSLPKRVLIVMAGPLMNLFFPIVLFASVYVDDQWLAAPVVGTVLVGSPAEGKLDPGDRILSIGTNPVHSFLDVQKRVAEGKGEPLKLRVKRGDREFETTVVPALRTVTLEPEALEIRKEVYRLDFSPRLEGSVVGVVPGPAYAGGLRTFDRVVAVNGRHVESLADVLRLLSENRGESVKISYLRPVTAGGEPGDLFSLSVMEPRVALLAPKERERDMLAPEDHKSRVVDVLHRFGIESAEMYVSHVPFGSREHEAGLRPGDRVVSVDGKPCTRWSGLGQALSVAGSHELTWVRDGKMLSGALSLLRETGTDEFGIPFDRMQLRMTHDHPRAPTELVDNPNRFLYAVSLSLSQTWNIVHVTVMSLVRLVQGKLSLESVSGPMAMYDIAGQAGARGAAFFVSAMAFLSVNLGLVNLLPIPVLDGGHLLFFLAEAVRRRPLGLRAREILSLGGMVVLVSMMLLAFRNDVVHRWDLIASELRELLS